MKNFKDELLVESIGKKWVLKRSFSFYYLDPKKKLLTKNVIIPEGFITDFASTPRLLYSIFPPIGIYNKATIIHDFLYSSLSTNLTRKESDKFFLQSMEVLKVKKWKRNLMYLSVRIFGKKKFKTR